MNQHQDPQAEAKAFAFIFQQMILSLNEAAMIQLGKIVDPGSGKLEKNLVQARGSIDLLRMLKAKTAGNLSEAEQRLLDSMVLNLQLNYVEETRAANQGAAPEPESPGAQEPAAGKTSETPETREGEEPPPGNRPGQNN